MERRNGMKLSFPHLVGCWTGKTTQWSDIALNDRNHRSRCDQSKRQSIPPVVEASDNPDAEVKGKVFKIAEAELKAADEYEVSDYKRIRVLLRSGSTAWVYVRA
jgi:hypothetical protein